MVIVGKLGGLRGFACLGLWGDCLERGDVIGMTFCEEKLGNAHNIIVWNVRNEEMKIRKHSIL